MPVKDLTLCVVSCCAPRPIAGPSNITFTLADLDQKMLGTTNQPLPISPDDENVLDNTISTKDLEQAVTAKLKRETAKKRNLKMQSDQRDTKRRLLPEISVQATFKQDDHMHEATMPSAAQSECLLALTPTAFRNHDGPEAGHFSEVSKTDC